MADLEALSDLKAAFGNFTDMTTLITNMTNYLESITQYNKEAAGTDDIGTQYTSTVVKPTENLLELIGQVYDVVNMTGQNGQDASDGYTAADDDAASYAPGS
jgi:hypothetical protein